MTDDDPFRIELGSYLLGSLSPAEHAAVDRHLLTCAECRAEIASLAPLPGLLGRLTVEEAHEGLVAPPEDLLRRTLDAVRTERRAERRHVRRWQVLTAAAAVAAVVGVGVATVPSMVGGPENVAMAAAAGIGASGTGALSARTWGTSLHLELAGLPAAAAYQAYAMSRDGRTEVAATWGATPSGRAVVDGATAIQRADLAEVEIRTVDGRALLTMPC
ncbi:anti-sigma factor family protein [Pseudonocardia dioxanivorans]|uniref:Anti-sigma-K factor RskA n=1 Tax=Pseudonocardia dioxanivorans (strain ATCC 55486 / DSM 44775 / JCM 13855 / CB1190) TaxID=675635 RepID=F4CIU4_PSEUX|nr:zf-HC2 domain-containing protein [Pseudonocardia dioxanivorans]AEA22923.1 Anti-sigma-K factor RskA [Pseudonocardia dioxanivorans CB1190]